MASNILASDYIHVADGIRLYYEEISAAGGAVATGGEPYLDLGFVYMVGGLILPRTRVVRRRRFADCSLSSIRGFICEQECVPMELMIGPHGAEQAREYICSLIFFMVAHCRRGSGESVKSLRVGITVEIKGEEEEAEFLCERRMSRVLSYVYSGWRGSSSEEMKKEGGGGGDEEEEICAVCLDEMKVGAEVACTPCCHRFHVACLRRWFKTAGLCPLCRFMIDS